LAGLLLLPLAVPLLIFGAANALLLEAAVSLLLVAGAPFMTAAAIRASRT
jgi:heme exporter protein B